MNSRAASLCRPLAASPEFLKIDCGQESFALNDFIVACGSSPRAPILQNGDAAR
jgi:hypothetical protein